MSIIFLVLIIWRALLLIIGELSAYFILPQYNFVGQGFAKWGGAPQLWNWANFDGEHYLWISSFGYREYEYAFFPGYPIAIKLLSYVTSDPLISGLLISNICLGIFFYLTYKLFLLDYPQNIVKKGLFLFLAFPSAFYLGAVYSESLFLALTVGSIYAARKERLTMAVLLALLASLTRLVGILLIPVLLIIFIKQKMSYKKLALLLAPSLGLISVMIFNLLAKNDLLYFMHVQPSFGANRTGGEIIFLPQVIYRYIKIFFTVDFNTLIFFVAAQEFIFTLLILTVILLSFKKNRLEYSFFSFFVLIIPTLTGTLSSMPRYLLAAFPTFFIISKILPKSLYYLLLLLLFVLQIINVALFINGYWIS